MNKLYDTVLIAVSVIVITVVMMSLVITGLEKSDARRKEAEKVWQQTLLDQQEDRIDNGLDY